MLDDSKNNDSKNNDNDIYNKDKDKDKDKGKDKYKYKDKDKDKDNENSTTVLFREEQGFKLKPLRYYQSLRQNETLSYLISPGSQIMKIQPVNEEDPIRLMHIAQIMPSLNQPFWVYKDAPALLALKHFNDRSNIGVPNLSTILDGCNIFMTMDMLDSSFSPIVASRLFYKSITKKQTLRDPQPTAVVGTALSRVSRPLSVITGTYGIPQISPSATSALLDNEAVAPLFGRTVPTNAGDADASAEYLQSLGVTHFGIFHVRDEYGNSFRQDLVQAAQRRGITSVSVAYQDGNSASIQSALKILKNSDLRCIYGILQPGTFDDALIHAYDAGLVGDDYFWYLPAIDAITEKGFSLNRKNDAKLAAAIHGSQVVGIKSKRHVAFEEALSSLRSDPDFQSFFLESHPDPSGYKGVNISNLTPVLSRYSYTGYDAAMALGIAACQSEKEFFTGYDLFDQFKRTTFDGASGSVAFDLDTGTRKSDTVAYGFSNVFIDEEMSTDERIFFKSRLSTWVDLNLDQPVNTLFPTIYHDGTSNLPPQLPHFEEDLNLIPIGVFAVGWFFSGALILSCIVLGWWVQKYRNKQIVRAAQPAFLAMLLVGTLLMASSIIPMTFQEPTSQRGLNIACMITPWLFICGFSTAFSAIFTKAWRVKILVTSAMGMKRTTVHAGDVTLPFLVLTITNITILAAWTAIAPLVWTRVAVENNFDAFGRAVESYGTCGGMNEDGNDHLSHAFYYSLVGINFCVVIAACWAAFLTRDFPSQFNEAYYVSLSVAIMLESFLLGIPMVFLVSGNPTSTFCVRALLIISVCIAIVAPSFIPKLCVQRRASSVDGSMLRDWSNYVRKFDSRQQSHQAMLSGSLTHMSMRHSAATTTGRKPSSGVSTTIAPNSRLPSSVDELRARIALKKIQELPATPVKKNDGDCMPIV